MAAYSADDDGWQTCKPDMIIGSKNRVRGDIKFDGLLRVDGTIEGRITAPMESRIVISPGGCFLGDLTGLAAAYIDGKVVGDVSVERLVLGSQAAVHGDVTCRALRIEGGASIVGLLTVSPKAAVPSEYDEHRSLVDVLEDPLDGFSLEEDDGGDGDEGSGSPVRSASRHDSPSPAASRSSSPMRPARRDYRVVLLVLEPQVDFYPGGSCGPGFPLVDLGMGGGGEQELGADGSAMQRLSDAILLNMEGIDEIVISLDSHNRIHVAHSVFWSDKQGNPPPVNTLITLQCIQAGTWRPRKEESMDYCIAILQQLQASGQLYGRRGGEGGDTGEGVGGGIVIKPDHCLVGSQGASMVRSLHEAVGQWAAHTLRNVTYLPRELTHEGGGHQHRSNPFYSSNNSKDGGSAFAAASADDKVLGGGMGAQGQGSFYDLSFLRQLNEEDRLLVCGQAHSHCVQFGLTDVLQATAATSGVLPGSICVLRDATSTAGLVAETGKQWERWGQGAVGKQAQHAENAVIAFWEGVASSGVRVCSAQRRSPLSSMHPHVFTHSPPPSRPSVRWRAAGDKFMGFMGCLFLIL
eukprot:CAMPEP_0173178384 /NCGR_PEP_ID=MMETSP1141-20130122/5507_1 /TAXON_ID=483371 /ORGANISM="non described non described, Strain CCMP2298" /LENGTH=577 /DNA_ID=CAMNT_0014100871 /DNA_START=138 /DNA_END=1871 /DNA_ORIENTATION=-